MSRYVEEWEIFFDYSGGMECGEGVKQRVGMGRGNEENNS